MCENHTGAVAKEEKVCIIDCPVDYRENTKLTAHLKEVVTEYEHEKQ